MGMLQPVHCIERKQNDQNRADQKRLFEKHGIIVQTEHPMPKGCVHTIPGKGEKEDYSQPARCQISDIATGLVIFHAEVDHQ